MLDDHLKKLIREVLREELEPLKKQLADRKAPAKLYGARAIASHLGMSPQTVYNRASKRTIPVHYEGSTMIAYTEELDEWTRAGRKAF